jgi:hypothetical protein
MSSLPPNGAIPQAWTNLQAFHNTAQVARDIMNNPATPQIDRDLATDRYVRATDGIMLALDELREQRWLGRIGLLLARKDRV